MARRKKGLLGKINIPEGSKIIGLSMGAIGAKMFNAPAKKMLAKYLPADDPTTPGVEGRTGRLMLSGGKVLIGGILLKNRNKMIQDAGAGWLAVSGMELLDQLIPQLNINSVGYLDDIESVGEVVEIDLDRVAPGLNGYDASLENYQEVAGITDDYLNEEMELAGYY